MAFSSATIRLPQRDLDHVVEHAGAAFDSLRGASLFVTGATGFVGSWVTQSLVWANRQLGLGARMMLLTRAPELVRERMPFLVGDPSVQLLGGDMNSFVFPDGEFTYVLHMATSRKLRQNVDHPLETFDSDTGGTRRVLEFAATHGARRVLFTSSGAVYGTAPPGMPVSENWEGAPDSLDLGAAYGNAKRTSEWLCAAYSHQYGFDTIIGRLFAFMGPLLPLDAHYAFGNFVRDALSAGPVVVKGDGTPLRSYLYAADMAAWLWTLLVRGQSLRPYNVGSAHAVPIARIATSIAECADPSMAVRVEGRPGMSGRDYVPDTSRADQELGLHAWVSLHEGIRRTYDWYRDGGGQAGGVDVAFEQPRVQDRPLR